MLISQTEFNNFTWIDIFNPEETKLAALAEEYGLEYFLIRDSLERGHLPKIEKLRDYTFVILRAFSNQKKGRITNVNELSNKIAFFYYILVNENTGIYTWNFMNKLKSIKTKVYFYVKGVCF